MSIVQYIGLPYSDRGRGPTYDCWGLVRLFYRQEMGIDLPSLVGEYKSATWDIPGVVSLVCREREAWRQVEQAEQRDLVLINIGGKPRHVGVWLDGNRMLHTLAGHDSSIESLSSPKWVNRIEGFYRYG